MVNIAKKRVYEKIVRMCLLVTNKSKITFILCLVFGFSGIHRVLLHQKSGFILAVLFCCDVVSIDTMINQAISFNQLSWTLASVIIFVFITLVWWVHDLFHSRSLFIRYINHYAQ